MCGPRARRDERDELRQVRLPLRVAHAAAEPRAARVGRAARVAQLGEELGAAAVQLRERVRAAVGVRGMVVRPLHTRVAPAGRDVRLQRRRHRARPREVGHERHVQLHPVAEPADEAAHPFSGQLQAPS